ncbi:hypothetical protein CMO91_06345 [Candidatus Woesearchaeota archaeon]|nr:hypothetical protein [Candidatus Woesearchaeota archaeon]|tara:strand:+ start:1043 stop:1252 length:210 start_codon:yes stop_codon:yes gene_type:complete
MEINNNVIIAVVLGVLVVIAGVQAFQMASLKNNVQQGGGAAAQPVASGGGGGAQLPSNIQNLPGMVGGC